MLRKHKRVPGSWRYADYAPENLEKCSPAVRDKELTQREAEQKFRIPQSTIKNKLKNKHRHPTGRINELNKKKGYTTGIKITQREKFESPY